jgi:phosphate transport system substrate-binding protein
MYVYVKNRHIAEIPGLQELLYELTAEHTISPDGYLVSRGLVPLDDRGRNQARDMAISLQPVSAGAQ